MGSALLITSAALHALWNAIIKRDSEPRLDFAAVLALALFLTALALPFSSQPFFATSEALWWALGAGLLEAGYLTTLALSLEITSLGMTYTISRGGAMLIVWLFSAALLGEAVTAITLVGSFLVLAGIFLTHWKVTHYQGKKSQFGWAYLCAFFIAGYHLLYGQALKNGAQPIPLFVISLSLSFPIYLLSCEKGTTKKMLGKIRRQPWLLIVGGLFCALSFLLFLKGLADTGAGVGITLRNTSILFAQVFSLFIGEKFKAMQWFGAILVAVGAALITLP